MNKTVRTEGRRRTLFLYLVAGVLTWPVVTLMLYWGDRFTNAMPGVAEGSDAIGFWAAGGYALLVSVLILLAGWLQSTFRS